jgi:hypothetical protein
MVCLHRPTYTPHLLKPNYNLHKYIPRLTYVDCEALQNDKHLFRKVNHVCHGVLHKLSKVKQGSKYQNSNQLNSALSELLAFYVKEKNGF